MKNKNKTLLEAATDMLLNRLETTVSENISPSVLENLDLLALNTVLESATDALYDKYVDPEENDNEDIEYGFRALKDDIDNLHDLIRERQIGKPKVKGDEALDLTGAVLEEISARCESITKLCDNILRDSYTDFNSTITNFSESADEEDLKEGNSQNAPYGIPYPKFKHDYDSIIGHQELSVIALMNKSDKQKMIKWINDHMNTEYSYYEFDEDLKEGTEELDQIKSVMADIANRLKKNPNKTIKTNFGNVVGMGKTVKGFDYIKFQSQYRGATKDPKIAANDRNSHGYVLKHLTITD